MADEEKRARIGLVNGSVYEVQGDADSVLGTLTGSDPYTQLTVKERGQEKRVYVFRAHIASVEDVVRTASGAFL